MWKDNKVPSLESLIDNSEDVTHLSLGLLLLPLHRCLFAGIPNRRP